MTVCWMCTSAVGVRLVWVGFLALARAATFTDHFHVLGIRSAQGAHHLDATSFRLVRSAAVHAAGPDAHGHLDLLLRPASSILQVVSVLLLLARGGLIAEWTTPATATAALIVVPVHWKALAPLAQVALARLGVVKFGTAGQHSVLLVGVAHVYRLVVDEHFFHAAEKTGGVPEVPVLESDGSRFLRESSDVEWSRHLEVFPGTLIHNASRNTAVDTKCDILLEHQDAHCVVVPVGQSLEAEHIGDGIVAHVVADADATLEQFHCQVLSVSVVGNDAVLLPGCQLQGDVGHGLGL